jgi:uncharacterized protein Smg (DUF494 family)
MNDDREGLEVRRLLALIADHLEDFIEGDELALETLGESLEQGGFSSEDLLSAVLALRSLGSDSIGAAVVAVDQPPGESAQRVLSAHERESLSPEAWGYLLGLRRHGALDAEQFERVLDRLTASGIRPVGVELARDVAVSIALRRSEAFFDHGDGDLSH